ncbi:MAG: hypothetical protein CML68_06570 [Rhodobacteraceae bacterium]|nr:hypothetical protein [Paracoccaceae bacterium]
MKLSLRERRRKQTAMDIQRATLALARESGFDHVTTDAISERAGISPRTFFNYYTNKEAAAVGEPPTMPDQALELLRTGRGSLRDDLRKVLEMHLEQLVDRGDIISGIGMLWRENAQVRWLLEQAIEGMADDLATCLAERRPDLPETLRRDLADWTMNLSGLAIGAWVAKEAPSLPEALDRMWTDQLALAGFLAG